MTIEEMFNELENKVKDTYIVTLKYKYDFEKDYTIENQILEYDSMTDNYVWLDDWYEGQTDVEVLGYRLLSDIDNTKLKPCEDAISRQVVLEHICEGKECYKEECKGRTLKRCPDLQWVFDLPPVTPTSEDIKESYLKGYDYGVKDWFKSKTQPSEDAVSREAVLSLPERYKADKGSDEE